MMHRTHAQTRQVNAWHPREAVGAGPGGVAHASLTLLPALRSAPASAGPGAGAGGFVQARHTGALFIISLALCSAPASAGPGAGAGGFVQARDKAGRAS